MTPATLPALQVPFDGALVRTGAFSRGFGHRRKTGLLAEGPDFTALLAASDIVAAGAAQAAVRGRSGR
ncbi:hypothetical protein [Streptomyces tanashiensis]|uniref:hypothetical protein n=1 Tax=Streptomyces tanashiensis TaxID=67367 RepID=UPI0033E095AA